MPFPSPPSQIDVGGRGDCSRFLPPASLLFSSPSTHTGYREPKRNFRCESFVLYAVSRVILGFLQSIAIGLATIFLNEAGFYRNLKNFQTKVLSRHCVVVSWSGRPTRNSDGRSARHAPGLWHIRKPATYLNPTRQSGGSCISLLPFCSLSFC